MQDTSSPKPLARSSGAWVDAIANRALAVVAERKSGGQRALDPELLALMRSCLLQGDRAACRMTVAAMTDAGVRREEIAELYVPALARQLGDDWCEDALTFADVTIGTSKLQALLRELGPDWRADRYCRPDAKAALVVVDSGEQHTLGAQVLAGRLRREGLSVRLLLSTSVPDIAAALEGGDYDVAFVSASCGDTLASVRHLVDTVRKHGRKSLPVVVGGALDVHRDAILAATGADFATSDIDEALRLCGLNSMTDEARPRTRRG